MSKYTKSLTKKIAIHILLITGAILGLLIILWISLPYLVNSSDYKNFIIKQFAKQTGRQLIIAGPIDLKLYPTLKIKIQQVAITNPTNFEPGNLLSIDSITTNITIPTLLRGKIEFRNLILNGISLSLIQNHSINNWTFNFPSNTTKTSKINYVFNQIVLKNFHFSYQNNKNKIQPEVFNLFINKDGGQIELNNNQIKINKTTIDLGENFHCNTNFTFDRDSNSYIGNFHTSKFSLVKIFQLLKIKIPKIIKTTSYSNIKLSFNIKGNTESLSFDNLKLALNNIDVNGKIKIKFNPYTINQNLQIAKLNIEDTIDLNGFKLKTSTIKFWGNITLESNFKLSSIKGHEYIHIDKLILYGFNLKKFASQLNKVVNDISVFSKFFTHTRTLATLRAIRQEFNKLNGLQKKDYSDISDLGEFDSTTIFRQGLTKIQTCKLNGQNLIVFCEGYYDLINIFFDMTLQGRIISSNEQTIINYLYFPYDIYGSPNHINKDLEWSYIFTQINNYLKTHPQTLY